MLGLQSTHAFSQRFYYLHAHAPEHLHTVVCMARPQYPPNVHDHPADCSHCFAGLELAAAGASSRGCALNAC